LNNQQRPVHQAVIFLRGGFHHGNHTHHAAAHRQGPHRKPSSQRHSYMRISASGERDLQKFIHQESALQRYANENDIE